MRLTKGIGRMMTGGYGRRAMGFRDFFGLFDRTGTQIAQLKATLEQTGTDPVEKARTHNSLTRLLLKSSDVPSALPHAQASFSLMSSLPLPDLPAKTAALESSRLLMETLTLNNQVELAKNPALLCEKLARELYTSNSTELARSLFGVSYVEGRTGNVNRAEKLCEETVEILRQGKDEAFLGDVLSSLGSYYLISNKNTEAITTLTEAISHFQSAKYYTAIPNAYLALADVYTTGNEVGKAKESMIQAYNLLKKYAKEDVYGMFLCCSRLGIVYFQEENYTEALSYLTQKANAMQGSPLETPQEVLMTKRLIGSCEVMLGNAQKGREVLESILPLAGEHKVEMCKALRMLCRACHSLHDSASLQDYSTRMITLAPTLRDDPDAPACLLDYAMYREEAGDGKGVIETLSLCVEMAQAMKSSFAPIASMNLGYYYARQKDYVAALGPLRKGYELLQELSPSESEELALSLHDLAIIETAANELESAESNFRKSLKMKQTVLSHDRESILKTRLNLAKLLRKMKKTDNARSILVEGLEGASPSEAMEIRTLLESLPGQI